MILVFLGSWRSTLIIAVSIPLSILVSLLILDALGYTLNVMTLGGLSLAVGILVDDATVELENIHRNLGINNKPLTRAVLDGAQQIAVPAFVATLSICIVFVSVVFLTGPARFLFIPLALAVVFAMMTSYLLSRTLVPVMVHFLLVPGGRTLPRGGGERAPRRRGRHGQNGHDGPIDEQVELPLRGERMADAPVANGHAPEPPRQMQLGLPEATSAKPGAEERPNSRTGAGRSQEAGRPRGRRPRTRIGSGGCTSGSTVISRISVRVTRGCSPGPWKTAG